MDGISVCCDQRSGNGGIRMETYLEKLLSQIRCKKARPYIAEEIRDHIECQIADNLSEGMTSEEAEKNAVTDMGDPVEVGISLDRIHKPKIAWKLLVIVGILSLLGILIQQSILRQPGYQELETWRQEVYRYTTEGFVSAVADWIPPHVCDLLPGLYRNCKVLQVHRRSYSDSGRAAGGRLRSVWMSTESATGSDLEGSGWRLLP